MSLVRRNGDDQWQIVLRNRENGTVVLHNSQSNELSVLQHPALADGLDEIFHNGNIESRRRRSVPICSSCGQVLPNNSTGNDNGNHEIRDSLGSTTSIKDVNYFKLLEGISDGADHRGIPIGAFSDGYFERFFVTKGLLGKGSNGVVYLVEHVLDGVSLGLFALKKIPIGDNREWLQKALGEVTLLRMLTHPNLISYNHVWLENSSFSSFTPSVPCAFILQEYCNGGTLENYVTKTGTWKPVEQPETKRDRLRRKSKTFGSIDRKELLLSNMEIVSLFTDIVRGVNYLHAHHIIHRDLKPSNCLLILDTVTDVKRTAGYPMVLVSDFGEGQMEGILRSETGSTGTLEYCAPELLKKVNGHLAQFSIKTDIFSLGMILYYLIHSKLPYKNASIVEEEEDLDLLAKEIADFTGLDISSQDMRYDVDPGLYSLIASMCAVDSSKRPNSDKVLNELEIIRARISLQPEPEPSTNYLLTMGDHDIGGDEVEKSKKWKIPWNSYYLLKIILIGIKCWSLKYSKRMEINQLLILILGIEIPISSWMITVSLFILHFAVMGGGTGVMGALEK